MEVLLVIYIVYLSVLWSMRQTIYGSGAIYVVYFSVRWSIRQTIYESADMYAVYVAVSSFILHNLPSSFVVFRAWSMRSNLCERIASVGLTQARPINYRDNKICDRDYYTINIIAAQSWSLIIGSSSIQNGRKLLLWQWCNVSITTIEWSLNGITSLITILVCSFKYVCKTATSAYETISFLYTKGWLIYCSVIVIWFMTIPDVPYY